MTNTTKFEKCSRKSLRRFVKLFLSLNEPVEAFHQTLTFAEEPTEIVAKAKLTKLLKNLTRRFKSMGAVYVQERQNSGRIHYHIRFMFFDGEKLPFSPSVIEKKLRQIIFEAWNKLNDGKLCQQANKFYRWTTDLGYFLGGVRLTGGAVASARPEYVWWGAFNRSLLRKNSKVLSKKEISLEIKKTRIPKARKSPTVICPVDFLFLDDLAA